MHVLFVLTKQKTVIIHTCSLILEEYYYLTIFLVKIKKLSSKLLQHTLQKLNEKILFYTLTIFHQYYRIQLAIF